MKISEILNEENNQKEISGLKSSFYIDEDNAKDLAEDLADMGEGEEGDYKGVSLLLPYKIGGRVVVSDLSIFRPQPQELSKKNDFENPLDDIQSNKFGNDSNEFYNIRGKMQSQAVEVGNAPAQAFHGTFTYVNDEPSGFELPWDDKWSWEDGSVMPMLLVYTFISQSLYPLISDLHEVYPVIYSMRDLPSPILLANSVHIPHA